ncbi:ABC transporter permease [Jidongwangia harbinensis]|uniref:ABC transporter permease n=1 Tax=Jidongwangia harbinensis TaxID=2878561 RepID=UPI001CD9DCBB|nr:ABC transporter permease [Jidongwangia harbinensis]MCA2213995.1 ABC transporter permease [Jidongwangia harbinensis]
MTAVDTARQPAGPQHATARAPQRSAVPLHRLIVVELRKLADTRAGLWLLIVIALAAAATVVILLFAADAEQQTFVEFFTFAQLPSAVLLPVLGILSVTSEWSQRTALTTFTLVPERGRVLTAKLIAAVLIAVLALGANGLFAVVGNAIASATGGDGSWTLGGDMLVQALVLQVVLVLMGYGFGALLLNSPVAIVLYFALPTVWSILAGLVKTLRTAAGWLDINQTTTPLSEPAMTGDEWTRLGVSVLVWVVVPLVVGWFRVLRREVA